jgi:hypothetical protein
MRRIGGQCIRGWAGELLSVAKGPYDSGSYEQGGHGSKNYISDCGVRCRVRDVAFASCVIRESRVAY